MLKKILIYNSGGGLGDAIQLFPLILSLKNHFKNTDFFYLDALGPNEKYFSDKLKNYNIKIKTLDLELDYFGFRWWHLFKAKTNFLKLDIGNFDLIIDIQSKIRNTLILKRIPTIKFYSSTYNYLFCSNKKKYSSNKNINQKTLSNLGKFFDTDIKKINYDINNLDKSILEEAKKLLPHKGYIGFSMTHANLSRKKDWPIEKFIELAKRSKDINKKPVFFVEKKNYEIVNKIKESISDAFFPEHSSDLASPGLVTALASRLDCAVTIDNGIMHMMSLAQIPLIVLFGPTKPEKFAPNQKNITVIDSKELYKTSDISKIKIDDVFKYI